MRKTRKFLAGTDPLETRTVLSTMHPSAHVLALHGSGTLNTATATTTSGGVQATVSLAGSFTGLGQTTGTIDTVIPSGGLKFSASGVLTAADGDQLDIAFSGANQKVRPHETKAVGRFHFKVDGGTGAFATATGGGTITVTEVLATGKETFTLSGKVVE